MKKLQTSLLVLALAASANGQAKGYLGAGLGYAHAGGKIIGGATNGSNQFNKQAGASGWIADVHAGHYSHINPHWFTSQQLAIAWDTPRAKGSTASAKALSITRLYNVVGTLGLGYKFAPTWDAYGKLGLANGALRFRDKTPGINHEHTQHLWGLVLGAGVNKIFDAYTVGLDYEYTRYQGPKYAYQSISGLQYDAKVKKPTYHAVMAKFSKSF